jgi:hypothetical protein
MIRTHQILLDNHLSTRLLIVPRLWSARCQFSSAQDGLRGTTGRPFEIVIVRLLQNAGIIAESC